MYTKQVILHGNHRWDIIGKMLILGLEWSMPLYITITNILVIQADLSLLLLLIDAIVLFVVLWTWTMEVHLKVLLEQEKHKLLRILPKHLLDSVLCSIAQMVLIIELWVSSLKDWHHQELGHVSMNSTELIYRCSLWLHSRFWQSQLQERKVKKYFSLKMQIFL